MTPAAGRTAAARCRAYRTAPLASVRGVYRVGVAGADRRGAGGLNGAGAHVFESGEDRLVEHAVRPGRGGGGEDADNPLFTHPDDMASAIDEARQGAVDYRQSTRVDRRQRERMMTHGPVADGRSMRPRRATRLDVARLAGTSTAVVSYVINNGPRPVADETRARVLAAVKELDYRPNALARSLRAQRTHALGLIVPDLANPFFAELARSIEMKGSEYGEALLLGNSLDAEERERQYVRTFLEYRVDGLIIVPVGDGRKSRPELVNSEIPIVVLDRCVPGLAVPTILPDNVEGARLATEHLLEHGYGDVACLAGPQDLSTADERLAGWAAALDDAGVANRRRLVVRSPFGRKAGYLAARELLSEKSRPRSLFASSDEQAFGVLRAAAQLKLRVPDDLAVVGFDGLQHSRSTVPQLTTMRQPLEQAGELAVHILHDNATDRGGEILRLPVTLQRGGSCGCEEDLEEGDTQ